MKNEQVNINKDFSNIFITFPLILAEKRYKLINFAPN
jgi:hypothetical protein